ncbi:MAG: substrate-binding domain-containing protein [Polyangia bacterium]
MLGTIGLFLRTTDNDFQRRLQEVGQREAKHHDFDLFVESAQFDASRQVAQIRQAIQKASATKLVAIMVSGVKDEDLRPVAHEAAEAGLDWALLNEAAFIDDVRSQYPDRAIFEVASDQVEIGRIHAQQVQALLGSTGRVLCVTGYLGNVAALQRLEGLKQGLESKFEIIELNADWTSERARMAVEKWASGVGSKEDLPGMFVAHNDEMALGVRQALRDIDSQRSLPLASAPITGCDGSQTFGQRLVRERRLKATVIMPPGSGVAIEWIARARTKGEKPPVRVLLPATSFPALSNLQR